MDEVTYKGLTFETYISREEIAKQVQRMALEIQRDCKDENPLFLCVLNGAFIFAADLFRACNLPDAEITFIRFKSYEGTSSTGEVKKIMGLSESIEGRTVIIVEDIVDTGVTAQELRNLLATLNPKTVKMATLLFKPASLTVGLQPEYVGFEIPSKFIIGYGLDLDGLARNLSDIYVLKEDKKDED
ncbi:MAG: hypoxanthine phosphoribosyltransferase [Muribaculaceae bacterium]|nr:hypoxanthine phosphoribosyltransferase [Muribaculaceae bacterium]MBR3101140.1 hypoxanthine phosphoribosyltransferase [Muribaculaceae bacterium]